MKKFIKIVLRNDESGTSMISVLVTVLLALILIVQLKNAVENTLKIRTHIQLVKSKYDARRVLLTTMDCSKFDYSCSNDDLVELRNFEGDILISKDSNNLSTYGSWTLKATCKNSTPEVKFALVHPESGFREDPKSNLLMDWNRPPVIEGGILCRAMPNTLEMVSGPRCDRTTRYNTGSGPLTGPSPNSWYLPGNICNPNGADGTKPTCPTGKSEWYSYWDRDDDWGMSGTWVVACR